MEPDFFHQYKALNPSTREIRLVVLHPGKFKDTISCDIIHESLDARPSYDALSYHWGDPTPAASIFIHKQKFLIGPNLESALRHLRSVAVPKILWIDAISINQPDLKEKELQVKMMADIFRRATKVRSFLGSIVEKEISMAEMDQMLFASSKLSISTDLQMATSIGWDECSMWELVQLFATNSIVPVWNDTEPPTALQESSDLVLLSEIMKTSFQHPDAIRAWKTLQHMLEQPYWNRVWIQQEVICSGIDAVILHYGKHHCPLLLLWRLGKLFERTGSQLSMPWRVGWLTYLATCFSRLTILSVRAFSAHLRRGPQPKGMLTDVNDVWGLLRDQFQNRASNPVDKIYGLLGMIEPWAEGGLEVDYTASLSEVYCAAAKSLIQHFKSLHILTSMISPEFRDPSLPSWCVDWSLTIDIREQTHVEAKVIYYGDIPKRLIGWQHGKPLQASAKLQSICKFSPNGRILSADEFCIAHIKMLNSEFNIKAKNSRIKIEMENIKAIAFSEADLYPTREEAQNALWRTLCTDRPFYKVQDGGDFAPSSYQYAFNLWCDPELMSTCFATEDTNLFYNLTSQIPPPLGPPKDLEKEGAREWLFNFSRPFFMSCLMATGHRQFIVSEAGFGLAPKSARVGDKLCVLLGCEAPVVLRPVEDYYIFLGECYVFGWMYGRAIDRAKEGTLKQQTFDIH